MSLPTPITKQRLLVERSEASYYDPECRVFGLEPRYIVYTIYSVLFTWIRCKETLSDPIASSNPCEFEEGRINKKEREARMFLHITLTYHSVRST